MLPKLADDTDAAKAVGGDRCYLSSPAPSRQIVPGNKAINLIDQHINFIATFMLQLERDLLFRLKKKKRAACLARQRGSGFCLRGLIYLLFPQTLLG